MSESTSSMQDLPSYKNGAGFVTSLDLNCHLSSFSRSYEESLIPSLVKNFIVSYFIAFFFYISGSRPKFFVINDISDKKRGIPDTVNTYLISLY